MYRERFILLLVAVIALMSAGCTKSELVQEVTECTFQVGLDADIRMKSDPAAPQTLLADRCVMELFYNGESAGKYEEPLSAGTAQFSVAVVAGRVYDIAFWADKTGCYETGSLKNVKIPETGYDYADNSMDAFCAVLKNVPISQTQGIQDVTLKRPMSKVSVTNASSQTISYSAPASYNVVEDSFGAGREFSYANPAFYIFAPAEKTTIDITIGTLVCNSVPIQRNFLTNIIVNQ